MCSIQRDLQGLYIVGNTYPYKDILKALNMKWDAQKKCWRPTGNEINYDTLVKQFKENNIPQSKKPVHCTYHNFHDQGDICPFESNRYRKFFTQGNGCYCNEDKPSACALCYVACCNKAKSIRCVGLVCYECIDHGQNCYGSHE